MRRKEEERTWKPSEKVLLTKSKAKQRIANCKPVISTASGKDPVPNLCLSHVFWQILPSDISALHPAI